LEAYKAWTFEFVDDRQGVMLQRFILGLLLFLPACHDSSRPERLGSEKCAKEVLRLRVWLKEITTETEESPVHLRPSISLMVANIDRPNRPTSSGPLVEISEEHTYVENQLASTENMKRLFEETARQARDLGRGNEGKTLPRLLVAVDRDAHWSRLVEVHDAASRAGFTRLSILFTPYGHRSTNRPGPSGIDEELEEIQKTADPTRRVAKLAGLTRGICSDCPPLEKVFKSLSVTSPAVKTRVITRYLPDAVAECCCAVDLQALEVILWTMLERPAMIAGQFEIAAEPNEKQKVVKLPPDTPWHKAHIYVLSLIKPGYSPRVRFEMSC